MSHRIITLQVPSPAAGADWSFVPSQTDHCRLFAVTALLTTSATVANRRPALALADLNALTYYSSDCEYPQVASLAVRYSWAWGASNNVPTALVTGERCSLGLPRIDLRPADTVESVTLGIQAGDQWSSIIWRGLVGDSWEDEELGSVLAVALGAGPRN